MLGIGISIADDPRALVAGTAIQKLDQGLERYWRDALDFPALEAA